MEQIQAVIFKFVKKTMRIWEGGFVAFEFECYVNTPLYFTELEEIEMESTFQKKLKKLLKTRFPGCVVFKGDCLQMQGCPDLFILFGSKWAALEVKNSGTASHRPNQDYRIKRFNDMSFAAFIFPENLEEILNDLERFFLS